MLERIKYNEIEDYKEALRVYIQGERNLYTETEILTDKYLRGKFDALDDLAVEFELYD